MLEFDFMRGEETYKQHWATDIRYDIKLELFHSQWRSQGMNILCQGKRCINRFFHLLA